MCVFVWCVVCVVWRVVCVCREIVEGVLVSVLHSRRRRCRTCVGGIILGQGRWHSLCARGIGSHRAAWLIDGRHQPPAGSAGHGRRLPPQRARAAQGGQVGPGLAEWPGRHPRTPAIFRPAANGHLISRPAEPSHFWKLDLGRRSDGNAIENESRKWAGRLRLGPDISFERYFYILEKED